jgi:hypothetical protein
MLLKFIRSWNIAIAVAEILTFQTFIDTRYFHTYMRRRFKFR